MSIASCTAKSPAPEPKQTTTSAAADEQPQTTQDESPPAVGRPACPAQPDLNALPQEEWLRQSVCEPWDPDSCPRGMKCAAYADEGSSWDRNKCVFPGTGRPGDPCVPCGRGTMSGVDSCGLGSTCWNPEVDTRLGRCVEHCSGTAEDPACPSGFACSINNDGVLALCLPSCDPLEGKHACPGKEVCIFTKSAKGFTCVLNASGGQGTYGTECKVANACNHGLFCAGGKAVPGCGDALDCCTEYCPLGEDFRCRGAEQGQVCLPYMDDGEASPEFAHVGYCGIPEKGNE